MPRNSLAAERLAGDADPSVRPASDSGPTHASAWACNAPQHASTGASAQVDIVRSDGVP